MTRLGIAATVPIRDGQPPKPVREVLIVRLLNVGRKKQLLDVPSSYLTLLEFEVVDTLDLADGRGLHFDRTTGWR